jgi:hypothetical protein
VLQSSEGGSFSVGNRKFRVKRSVTPPVTPVSVAPLEGVPVAMPTNLLTERIPPRARSSRFSTLAAATDKIVISKNVLIGLCLTTFAFGIVTTLAVDRVHARAGEAPPPREQEPVVLQTTPIEPEARPAAEPPSAAPAPSSPPPSLAAPPSALPAVQPQAAAAEAVVVQLPPIAEKVVGKLAAPLPPPPASRTARQVASMSVRATPPATRKRAGATAQVDSSFTATEAAPDEEPALPAPIKKKWVDPFDQ